MSYYNTHTHYPENDTRNIAVSDYVNTKPGRYILRTRIMPNGDMTPRRQWMVQGTDPADIYIAAYRAHKTAIVRSYRVTHRDPVAGEMTIEIMYDVYPSRWDEDSYVKDGSPWQFYPMRNASREYVKYFRNPNA